MWHPPSSCPPSTQTTLMQRRSFVLAFRVVAACALAWFAVGCSRSSGTAASTSSGALGPPKLQVVSLNDVTDEAHPQTRPTVTPAQPPGPASGSPVATDSLATVAVAKDEWTSFTLQLSDVPTPAGFALRLRPLTRTGGPG